jgi:hypothetical protein
MFELSHDMIAFASMCRFPKGFVNEFFPSQAFDYAGWHPGTWCVRYSEKKFLIIARIILMGAKSLDDFVLEWNSMQ